MYGMTVSVLFMFLGYPQFLLPLMITFAAARYTGNAINAPMYDMHIQLKQWFEEAISADKTLLTSPVYHATLVGHSWKDP